MDAQLIELAERLGIAINFSDAGLKQKDYIVDEKTVKFFAKALGYPADSSVQIEKSLSSLDNYRWKSPLQPIYICPEDKIKIDIVSADLSDIKLSVVNKNGDIIDVSYNYCGNAENKGLLYKEDLFVTTPLPIGYYELNVIISGKKYKSTLAVAPQKCYEGSLKGNKLWGYALQLYSLKSKRNWGIGDFTDLADFVKLCSESGADIIGLNPLNTLSHDYPENASPYSSISRLFLNPIYIDVEAVPEFLSEYKSGIEELLEELRNSELIDYGRVYPLKIKILEKCFKRFQEAKDKKRQKDFKEFCLSKGSDLDRLAVFQAIYEVETKKVWGGMMAWPEEYRHPNSSGIKTFISKHKDRVEFFKFMQFEADRQFTTAQQKVKDYGLKIGFYRDLAVGVGRDSAEYWSNSELFMRDAGTGAPPDAFFPTGQKWGLGTFLPQVLKEQKYEPFIRILRANMQNAGALRIDHVMSLMRLYVIPDALTNGTYIYYNFEDMLNIVALESQLNQCIVVGESIGNVPEGFMEAIQAKNIHSLSILWAERWNAGWGDFLQPHEYPSDAFTSVATHDIAPLKMWWFGFDIELSRTLGLICSDEEKSASYHKRETDRKYLLSALDKACVWPEDKLRQGDYIYGENYPEGIEEAVERFVAKSNSPVFLTQLEDILHIEKMQNLPGTDRDKHPNWRRKLSVNLEDLPSDIAYIRCINAIKKER